MKISITAGEAMDKGIWMEICELTGLNDWAINEGLMHRDDTIDLNEEQAKKLGLIKNDM